MSSPFPITIDGSDYPDVASLAAEIARRGNNHVLGEQAWGHPSVYFRRWMDGDESGKTSEAVSAACLLIAQDPKSSGDAIEHAVALARTEPGASFPRAVLDAIERGVPDSQFFGSAGELGAHLLSDIVFTVRTQAPGDSGRLYSLMAAHGLHLRALDSCFQNDKPDPQVFPLTEQWLARPDANAAGVRGLVDAASLFAGFAPKYAVAFSDAPEALKEAFLAAMEEFAPGELTGHGAAIRVALEGASAQVRANEAPAEPAWNSCQGDGLLTDPARALPSDERDFYPPGRLDLVSCSHLSCSQCNEVVRWIDRREPTGSLKLDALYGRKSWSRAPGLRKTRDDVRFYACRCAQASIRRPLLIAHHNRRDDVELLPWSCAGHPAVVGPLELDGVTVGSAADASRLTAKALQGDSPGGDNTEWAEHGAIWALRLFARLAQNPHQEGVASAVAAALVGEHVGARAQALVFYLQQPFAAHSDGALSTAFTKPELFAGVRNPSGRDNESLEFQLLRVLGTRYRLNADAGRDHDTDSKKLLREASQRADLAGATLQTLAHHDLRWVLSHEREIASASPANARALLLWVGIVAPDKEAELRTSLREDGLLSEDS